MRFVTESDVRARLEGRRVAIVGSGPGVLDNEPGFIDGHDEVIRVNNYQTSPEAGRRTSIYYSFFGHSIRKSITDLRRDGVTLCLCKCPNAAAIESEWHRQRRMLHGTDFRWIYRERERWWFCDVYVPTLESFQAKLDLLNGHVPTTGFSAILDVLTCAPGSVYLTGFDFFRSRIHNVNESWREKNPDDPIRHLPDQELRWLADNRHAFPITCDARLTRELQTLLVTA